MRAFVYAGNEKVVMKIAQIAPLIESVPPRLYGGTERIVSCLTEELVSLGHEVTLFASADSITSAELAPCCNRALRLDDSVRDIIPHYMLMVDKVRERAVDFDILHFHIDLFHFPLFRSLEARTSVRYGRGRQDSFLVRTPGDASRPECHGGSLRRSLRAVMPASLPLRSTGAGQ